MVSLSRCPWRRGKQGQRSTWRNFDRRCGGKGHVKSAGARGALGPCIILKRVLMKGILWCLRSTRRMACLLLHAMFASKNNAKVLIYIFTIKRAHDHTPTRTPRARTHTHTHTHTPGGVVDGGLALARVAHVGGNEEILRLSRISVHTSGPQHGIDASAPACALYTYATHRVACVLHIGALGLLSNVCCYRRAEAVSVLSGGASAKIIPPPHTGHSHARGSSRSRAGRPRWSYLSTCSSAPHKHRP